MTEETVRVPPASPLNKPRRSVESPRSSTSSGKGVPIYLRTSTGSCHEFCKHGKPEGHVSEVKETRPWRKPVVSGASPKSLHTKETEVPVISKKTVVPKPKPSADPKTQETTIVDVTIRQTADAPEITSACGEIIKPEVSTPPENVEVPALQASLDPKKLSAPKKTASVKLKPPVGSHSPISAGGSSLGRRSIDGRKSVDGKKSVEVRKSLDVRKRAEGSKNIDKKKSLDEKKGPDEIKNPETAQKSDEVCGTAENSSEGSKTADGIQSQGGSDGSNAKIDSAVVETKKNDGNLSNAKIKGGSELLKKHVAAPRPKIPQVKPAPSLSTVKPHSPSLSNSTRIRTSDDDTVAKKLSTLKVDTKKVGVPAASSLSPGLSENGVESSTTKKVRSLRVVSSVKRTIKTTKVDVKDPNDLDVQGETSDTIKADPEKKSSVITKNKVLRSTSSLSSEPPAIKSTVRTRVSYFPSRPKKPVGEPDQKDTSKDKSVSVLRKGKAVDIDSGNQEPPKLRVRRISTLVGEATQINRRILRKGDGLNREAVGKTSSSDRQLLRRQSVRGKKNVQVLFNKVIEETANRLVRIRKSKVLALVGAFETVISIQKKKSATGGKPKPRVKRIGSTSKPRS